MLAAMPATVFAEWVAYAQLEPFGPLREDLRAGLIVASNFNAAPFRGKNATWLEPKDFFASLRPPRPKPHQLVELAKIANAAMGGKFE